MSSEIGRRPSSDLRVITGTVWAIFAGVCLVVGFYVLPLFVFVLAATIALFFFGPGVWLGRAAAGLAFVIAAIFVALTATLPGQQNWMLYGAAMGCAVGVFTFAAASRHVTLPER